MRKYISLLLFIGLAWGQVEQDKLVLKDGTRYLGEFSTIDGENVLFKPEGAFGFQPISVKRIKNLQLKDGRFIIGKYNRELTTNKKVLLGCVFIAVVIYFMSKDGIGLRNFDMGISFPIYR